MGTEPCIYGTSYSDRFGRARAEGPQPRRVQVRGLVGGAAQAPPVTNARVAAASAAVMAANAAAEPAGDGEAADNPDGNDGPLGERQLRSYP